MYFEKDKTYNYDEIEYILQKGQADVMSYLCKSHKELDDSEFELMLTLHMISVLSAYKSLLLIGKKGE